VNFKKAVEEASPPINQAYRPGLQAMGTYSKKVKCTRNIGRTVTGSIDLDGALANLPEYAGLNRWDYGIGYNPSNGKECAVWIEVHSANDQEVGALVRKVKQLKGYLKAHAPKLWKLTLSTPENLRYIWLGTKSVNLSRHDPAFRRAMQEGIAPPRKNSYYHDPTLSLSTSLAER